MTQQLVLGPQRPVTNLNRVVADAEIPDAPVAVISAGWQEAEGDIDDVRALVPRPLVNLDLYQRAEALFSADKSLHAAYRERQESLKELQRLYRLRLRQLMTASRQLRRSDASPEILKGEEDHAISQLRALDRHHLCRVEAIHAAFEDKAPLAEPGLLAEQAAQISKILEDCPTILITGGHVAILMNRLRLFGLGPFLKEKNVIAWSAGAMVLSDTIVLYHDRTLQGRRDAELYGTGTGVLPGFVFLPDSKRRLKQQDSVRISLFYRRFAPAQCVTLDSDSVLRFEDQELRDAESSKRMTNDGGLAEVLIP